MSRSYDHATREYKITDIARFDPEKIIIGKAAAIFRHFWTARITIIESIACRKTAEKRAHQSCFYKKIQIKLQVKACRSQEQIKISPILRICKMKILNQLVKQLYITFSKTVAYSCGFAYILHELPFRLIKESDQERIKDPWKLNSFTLHSSSSSEIGLTTNPKE